MGRLMAIDVGKKRVGLAVTDSLQIIATALETVPANDVLKYIEKYTSKETVDVFVVGDPRNLDNTPAESAGIVTDFIKKLKNKFPDIPVEMVDERFTSKMAVQTMIMSGQRKKERQKKENLDRISATLILQTYLDTKKR